ncbi:MAG: tolB protein precursor protein [Alphaproteobacteria bacterium]|nr:tolB protein precursor protein [Alphaproteobacteria bacterium]MCB9699207.1 tolB protein precursor protein [Alphaproteobacteria bacterium]
MILLSLLGATAHAQIWVAPRRPGQSIFHLTDQEWRTLDLLEGEQVREVEAGGVRLFFAQGADPTAERAAAHLVRAYRELADTFEFTPPHRFDYVMYGTYQEFLRSNLFPVQEGVLGVTSTRGLEMALPYFGDHQTYEHTSTHELAHEFTLQKVRAAAKRANTFRDPMDVMPLWFVEGLAEYAALGPIEGENAMRVRDLVTNPDLYTGHGLLGFWDDYPGYVLWTYAGGHARISFLEETYGEGTFRRIIDASPTMVTDQALLTPWMQFRKLVQRITGDRPDKVAEKFDAWVKHRAYQEWLDSEQTVAELDVLDPIQGFPLAMDASPDGELVAYRSIGFENGRTAIHVVDPRAPGSSKRMVADTRPGAESLHPIDPRNFDLGDGRLAWVAESRGRDVVHVREIRTTASEETGPPPGDAFQTDDDGFFVDPDETERDPWWKVRFRKGPGNAYHVGRDGLLAVGSVALEPGGDRVAIVGLHQDGQRDLFLITPRGGKHHDLRRLTTDVAAERDVAWGPDGLVFSSDASPDGRYQLFTLDPNDPDAVPQRLTTDDRDHLSPAVLADGTVVYSSYDEHDRSELFATAGPGTTVRLTDLAVGAFEPAPGPDGGLWTLIQHHGRLRPTLMKSEAQRTLPGEAAPAAQGPPIRLPTRPVSSAVPYVPLDPRNWGIDGGFAAVGAGPGGVYGQVYLSFSDRLRDHGLLLVADAYGTPELTDAQLLYLDQSGRVTWGAGPFHDLRFRIDHSLPDTSVLFQSGERYYGMMGSLRVPIDRYVYVQGDVSAGGVSYFLFDDTAVFLADAYSNGSGTDLLDDWFRANPYPRVQTEGTLRLGIDTTRFHPTTGPVAGVTWLLEASGGVQPFDAQQYGSLRTDIQGYLPIPYTRGGNVGIELSGATSGGGPYATGYWLSSYDTLRAYAWGDPALLGRHYWFASSELQLPLDVLIRLAVASSVEGVVGLDFGGVADDIGDLWDRRALDVALGSNFVLGPLVLRLHFARAIDIGAPLPVTANPWVTNFSLSWLGG